MAIPSDAENVVIQTWSEWRTWDISGVKDKPRDAMSVRSWKRVESEY